MTVIMILYGVDFVISSHAAFGLSKTFEKAEEMLEDLASYMQFTRLYETREEIREKLESIRTAVRQKEMIERMNAGREEFISRFEAVISENPLKEGSFYQEKKRELERRLDEFSKKYIELRQKQNMFKRRMVHAYPDLKKGFRRYREKHQDKKRTE